MGVIFDLDQTLIDSSLAATYREARKWQEVYSLIPSFTVYDGILPLLEELNSQNIKMCIVTSSISFYCDKVLAHHKIPIIYKVCYHDTQKRKPHPDPILKALSLLSCPADKIVSIGDDPKDIIASRAANVRSVAATWGCVDSTELLSQNPDHICNSIAELQSFLREFYK